jgi:hypothetical protein
MASEVEECSDPKAGPNVMTENEEAKMGTIEQTGKVATSVIESLKSQPLSIALIVINVLFLGFFAFVANGISARALRQDQGHFETIKELIRSCGQKHSDIDNDEAKSMVFK